MPKVIGVDPGTTRWSFTGLETGNVFLEETLETAVVIENPHKVIELLKGADLVAAPSGYGLPVKSVGELTEDDLFQITLKKRGGKNVGVRDVLLMKNERVNGFTIPSVKHLPTVPSFRKINKIDMGTADKVCSAALAIKQNYKDFGDASFILAEIGSAFNAFISVEGGRIVDGIGGTLASGGFMSCGGIDGEVACLKKITKKSLFTGGLKSIAPADDKIFLKPQDNDAVNYFTEGIIKDIRRASVSCSEKTVFFSGRVSMMDGFYEIMEERLQGFDVRATGGFAKTSHASQGAALIADGMAGGGNKKMVEHMKLKNAKGSVLDDIFISGGV